MQRSTFTVEQIRSLLARAGECRLSAKAVRRLRWLLHYCEEGRSVSETCRYFGITRMAFYRLLERFDPESPETLEDRPRLPDSSRQAVAPATIELIRAYRVRFPQIGKVRIAALLLQEHGLHVSASAVGRVIEREAMYFGSTPLHHRKRSERRGAEGEAGKQLQALQGDEAEALHDDPLPLSQYSPHEFPALISVADEHSDAEHACFFCTWRKDRWPRLRRLLVIASILTNVLIAGSMLTAALLEGRAVHADLHSEFSATDTSAPLPPQ